MAVQLTDSLIEFDIRPQDDFFSYVNSKWLSENPIPDTESRWSTFHVLRDEAWSNMRDIYEGLQGKEAQDTTSQQAKDFYYTGINFDSFAARHTKIVDEYLVKIDAAVDTKSLSQLLGELHRIGLGAPWQIIIDTDESDSSQYIVRLYQSGLSLPDRDYYLSDDKDMGQVRKKYELLLAKSRKIFKGLAPSDEMLIKSIIDLETSIAKKQRTNSQLRDVEGNYNPIQYSALKKQYSNIDWDGFAQGLGWANTDNITVDQPEFLEFINQKFTNDNLGQWKIYLKWHLVRRFLPYVSNETSDINFQFYGQVISGAKQNMPLWQRIVMNGERLMGENVGKIYAERHFPEGSKRKVQSIVDDVTKTFAARIRRLGWMSDDTKQYAIKKLNNMKVLVGYPDEWRDFSELKISRKSYLDNIIAAEHYNADYELAKLGQNNSRDQWHMSPQTVNAYHDPNRLVICFPAAILRDPFFSPNASAEKNLGGIGVVIGHELTHAFDDQGCQFDADGNVRQWQTASERKSFAKKAQIIKDQANTFEVLPGLKLNADLIIGESIADIGGIEMALETLANYEKGRPSQEGIRELLKNYAFTEAHSVREQKAREFALIDPHPPSEFRVNAMLQHVDDFYKVFDIKEGDKLYRSPENRAKIW